MPLITKYHNIFDQEVEKSQVPFLDIYKELIIDATTKEVKRINRFLNGKLDSIKYFIEPSETESIVVSTLQNEAHFISICTSTVYPNYTIEHVNEYVDGHLLFRMRFLIVNAERICWETLDLSTGIPLFEKTEKFYEDGNGVEVLKCTYQADGSIDHIIYMPFGDLAEQDWEYFYTDTFSELQAHFIEDISYYLTAAFEPQ